METTSSSEGLLESSVLLTGFGIWVWSAFSVLPISLNYLPKEVLTTMKSDKVCQFTIDVDSNGFHASELTNGLSMALLKSKIASIFENAENPEKLLSYLLSQMKMAHLFEEVVISNRFLMLFFSLIVLLAAIDFLVVGPLENSNKDMRNLEQIGKEKNASLGVLTRLFILEKIIILAFVIVPNFEDTTFVPEKYKDFANYVNSKFAMFSHSTDVTVFAIWFCFIGLVFFSTQAIHLAFEQTIRYGSNIINNLSEDPAIQSAIVVVFIQFTFSMILIGISCTAFELIHKYYFAILLCDAFRCWFRSGYVLLRISVCVAASKIQNLSKKKENEADSKNEKELAEFILNGGNYTQSLQKFKRAHDIASNLICVIQYTILMYIGASINGKLLAVLLCRRISHHLRQLVTSFRSQTTTLGYLI